MSATALVALALLVGAAHARHIPGLTAVEERCQIALARSTDRFGADEAICIGRCGRKLALGKVPSSECSPPFAGRTLACIQAAATRAGARIERGCAGDCPECFLDGDCRTFGNGAVATTEAVVDRMSSRILCDDAQSSDGLTVAEARCRRRLAVALGKVGIRMGRCLAACRRLVTHGQLPIESCVGVLIEETQARECLDRAKAKVARFVERRCGDPPDCLSPSLSSLADDLEREQYFGYGSAFFCDSPSGAFLD